MLGLFVNYLQQRLKHIYRFDGYHTVLMAINSVD